MTDSIPVNEYLGDMPDEEFREAAATVLDQVSAYLTGVSSYPVLPPLEPGAIRDQIAAEPPEKGEPFARIMDDFRKVIEPHITHWQHPGFMAYFSSTASGPGILGEWLAAGLNSNVMFWRNAPAATELEEVTVDWLRQLYGLPTDFDGMFTDTASVSSLLSLVAARHQVPGLSARQRGLAGRPETRRLRIYCSEEAHSSIEKAAIVIGVGTEGVRRIPADESFRLRADRLAAAITEDRNEGWLPFCAVATLGTTSSTSLDPVGEMAAICDREGLWLHVDAAYGGTGAIMPERRTDFAGWERADSIVINPHKWMFTPFDASLLLFRSPAAYRDAFSLVPEYLRTGEQGPVHNYHEYGIQLGRRFRALKLWFIMRYFGATGLAARLREHCRQAREFAAWVDASADWERLAPVPFSVVCYRHKPAGMDEDELAGHNEKIMTRVNGTGKIFLSHTKLHGKYAIRLALGNLRAGPDHVRLAWELLVRAAKE